MRIALPLFVLCLPALAVACAGRGSRSSDVDSVAEAYVRLVLATGRHDASYVDAYYGPPEWKEQAGRGDPVPVARLLARARDLLAQVRQASGPPDRLRFLEAQLVAVEGYLRRLAGEPMPLAEEVRLFYDIELPSYDAAGAEQARKRLEDLVPGPGELGRRVRAFRERFEVPPDRLPAVVEACLEQTRRRTLEHALLPEGEAFTVSFVHGKSWGGYNWYRGEYRSLIEINTDLPAELGRTLRTIAHEGYPGHHAHNALLEERLVRRAGWLEFTVYPLYSPQSLVAEGTANAGLSVILGEAEETELLQDVLAPLADLDAAGLETYQAVRKAMRGLRGTRGAGARMLLDEGKSDEEVVAFLVRDGLEAEDRARKGVEFIREYRSYVFNYTVGEDLVLAWIGNGPDRAERFFDLLRRPVTPSELAEGSGS